MADSMKRGLSKGVRVRTEEGQEGIVEFGPAGKDDLTQVYFGTDRGQRYVKVVPAKSLREVVPNG